MTISKIFLWLFVIVLGLELGAGLYETFVVMPVWSLNPPDSVIAFYRHNLASPQFVLNAGGRFWMLMTPLTGLMAIMALLTGFRTRPEHRRWRIIGSVLAIIVVASTIVWFVPNIIRLSGPDVERMSLTEVSSLTNWWRCLNWVRIAMYSAGWLAALKALTVPAKSENV